MLDYSYHIKNAPHETKTQAFYAEMRLTMKLPELGTEIFENIQSTAPVVHNISNYITATDCANITLACGGAPTMADDQEEVAEVASACHASVINMGNTGGYFEESTVTVYPQGGENYHN